MIHGFDGGEALGKLEASPFEFHLTGSHFFHTNHRFSDWDFYTQYSDEVAEWLENVGFVKLDGYYANGIGFDTNTNGIWHMNGVDVQLCVDAEVKRISQKIIRDLQICVDKKTRGADGIRHVWNTLAFCLSR